MIKKSIFTIVLLATASQSQATSIINKGIAHFRGLALNEVTVEVHNETGHEITVSASDGKDSFFGKLAMMVDKKLAGESDLKLDKKEPKNKGKIILYRDAHTFQSHATPSLTDVKIGIGASYVKGTLTDITGLAAYANWCEIDHTKNYHVVTFTAGGISNLGRIQCKLK